MRKLYTMLAVIGCAVAAHAALDTTVFDEAVAFPMQTVTAGATVTNAVQAVSGCKGIGEITFAIGAVSAASSNRVITATLLGTNTVTNGWSPIGMASYKGADAAVLRLPFIGKNLPPFIKVAVGATVANSVVGGTIMTVTR